MIRVLVVDDHAMVRAGLTSVLTADGDIDVVAQAADAAGALRAMRSEGDRIDVVLMDLSMPGDDGVAATSAVLTVAPRARVVVLTSFSDRERVRQAVAAGAIGFQLKDADPAALRAAVRAAYDGGAPLDPRVAGALLPDRTRRVDRLSAREREVLLLAAEGMANKQIARRLGITERTVKAHLGNVYRQLDVADRTSAALWAREHLV
ncbi:response regulator transcription factor [Microbacterium hominis]|uniref:Response regulator transcription factor n=1 Tax=Microbacterium hominis TaxID=162426 RepID=A0A7D4Q298_9MICO|nr:response regulator transcription factor [Microbacterium hominis]QKJ19351.1 response regulator transcription factor [Microbacterium hominis]